MKIEPYPPEIESQMHNFYQSLSEKDRRRYAAIEAKKLGYGGIRYICRVLRFDVYLPQWNYTAIPLTSSDP